MWHSQMRYTKNCISYCFGTALFFSLIIFGVDIALGQQQPPNACPENFRYEHRDGHWVGIITAPVADANNVEVATHFAMRGTATAASLGALEPYPNPETVTRDLAEGRGAHFSVRFNTGNELPKITKIEVSGRVICQSDTYPPPSTTLIRVQKIMKTKKVITNFDEISNGNFDLSSLGSLGNVNVKFPPLTSLLNGQSPQISFDDIFKDLQTQMPNGNTGVVETSSQPEDCGHEGFVPFMHGGTIVERGRFPWLAAIYHDDNPDPNVVNLQFKCGATVAGTRKVITAAHCVYGVGRQKLRVYVGRHDLWVHPEEGATIKDVENVVIHHDYQGTIVPDSDLAVLTLSTPVEYTRYIRPICLWRHSDSLGSDGGQDGSVAGWGIDENGKMTQYPKVVDVRTVSQNTCLRDMVAAKDFLTSRTICAGNGQAHGPCLGDSGGGLMIKRDGRWMLRGIISLGSRVGDQCDLRRYVIYCDLAKHIDWLQQNLS